MIDIFKDGSKIATLKIIGIILILIVTLVTVYGLYTSINDLFRGESKDEKIVRLTSNVASMLEVNKAIKKKNDIDNNVSDLKTNVVTTNIKESNTLVTNITKIKDRVIVKAKVKKVVHKSKITYKKDINKTMVVDTDKVFVVKKDVANEQSSNVVDALDEAYKLLKDIHD